jgi:hypothetical protein
MRVPAACLAIGFLLAPAIWASNGALVSVAAAKVPKADKSSADVVGTVGFVVDAGFVCGQRAAIAVLAVKIGGNLYPLDGICVGGAASTCLALKPGARVRLQGVLTPVVDVNAPGYVPCDPSTYEYLPAVTAFGVTKITK